MSDGVINAAIDYQTDVPLFSSGAEAAAHGRAKIKRPGRRAIRLMDSISAKRSTEPSGKARGSEGTAQ